MRVCVGGGGWAVDGVREGGWRVGEGATTACKRVKKDKHANIVVGKEMTSFLPDRIFRHNHPGSFHGDMQFGHAASGTARGKRPRQQQQTIISDFINRSYVPP